MVFQKTLVVLAMALWVKSNTDQDQKLVLDQMLLVMNDGYKMYNAQDQEAEEFDFIIVGAGSAGSVLANRLSEVRHWNILLLEAGSPENNFTKTPIATPFIHFTPYNWAFKTEPQGKACKSAVEPRCIWPRGKSLGGSSAINFMLYFRGNPEDYNRWAEHNPGWSYEDVLPYFLKSEDADIENADPVFHNKGGNTGVVISPENELTQAFLDAGLELGYKNIDPNTRDAIGFSKIYATIKNKKRHSSATAYLDPIKKRRNLKIITQARVTKILIDPNTIQAYGVQYIWNEKKMIAKATREVILSAGVLNSPHLLMLSGIGPKEDLLDVGITPILDSPIGKTLYDHVIYIGLLLETNYTVIQKLFKDANGLGLIPLINGVGFVATEHSDNPNYPDVEIHISPITFASKLGEAARKMIAMNECYFNKMYKGLEHKNTIAIFPKVLRPKSKGYMKLKSNDPFDYPLFYPNYYSDPDGIDKKTTIAGIRLVERLAQTQAFKRFGVKVFDKQLDDCENFEYGTDEYWDCAIEYLSTSGFHQIGTCKMGPKNDPTAVVNHKLQVYGVQNLRVVDGSVIPNPMCSHLNAPTIMIGEKGADLIKEKWGELFDNSIEETCKNLNEK